MNPFPPVFFRALSTFVASVLVGASFTCCSAGSHYHKGAPPKPGAITHHAANSHIEPVEIPPACSPAWNQLVDARLGISDASGHGPDVGSAEWMDAVSRRSGVVDEAGHGPDPGSEEWCRAVDYKVFGRR